MIIFIDLGNQISPKVKKFAFFNTVSDKFEEFDGCQCFDSINEFREYYTGNEFSRFLNLITKKWKR